MRVKDSDIARILGLFDEKLLRVKLEEALKDKKDWDWTLERSEELAEFVVFTAKTGFEQGVWAAVDYLRVYREPWQGMFHVKH